MLRRDMASLEEADPEEVRAAQLVARPKGVVVVGVGGLPEGEAYQPAPQQQQEEEETLPLTAGRGGGTAAAAAVAGAAGARKATVGAEPAAARKSCAASLAGLWQTQRSALEMYMYLEDQMLLLGVQALCAVAVAVAVDRWIAIALAGGLIIFGALVFFDDRIALGFWLCASLLTVIPAALFASADEDAADGGASLGAAGVTCFVLVLWFLGWGFLWYRADRIRPIQPEQHLRDMPPSFMLRLKLVSVVYEGYNYSGFSFFPALPWKAMVVPPYVPHPQMLMLAGFFEFGIN